MVEKIAVMNFAFIGLSIHVICLLTCHSDNKWLIQMTGLRIINRNGNVIYVQSGNEALARTGSDGIICYVYCVLCVSNNKTDM